VSVSEYLLYLSSGGVLGNVRLGAALCCLALSISGELAFLGDEDPDCLLSTGCCIYDKI